jgi:small-conductance mechanosensitive channel
MNEILNILHSYVLNPNTYLGAIIFGLIFFGLALIGCRLIRLSSKKIFDRPALLMDKTSAKFVAKLLELLVFLIAMIAYAHLIPALQKLGTALLASAGLISIIVGLAAQSALANLMAGIALLFYRPFGIGDLVTLNNVNGKETGKVQEFNLGYTKLLTDDGRLVLAPNSLVIASIIVHVK